MKEIEILHCYIRCAFCNSLMMLKEAALGGWEVCNGCQLVFCSKCKNEYKSLEVCPGSVYVSEHKPIFDLLPIEQIFDLSMQMQRKPKEGRFVPKIFFEDEKTKVNIIENKSKQKQEMDFSIVRFREEQWRKFGTVLVKRKDGKFLTWGQID